MCVMGMSVHGGQILELLLILEPASILVSNIGSIACLKVIAVRLHCSVKGIDFLTLQFASSCFVCAIRSQTLEAPPSGRGCAPLAYTLTREYSDTPSRIGSLETSSWVTPSPHIDNDPGPGTLGSPHTAVHSPYRAGRSICTWRNLENVMNSSSPCQT